MKHVKILVTAVMFFFSSTLFAQVTNPVTPVKPRIPPVPSMMETPLKHGSHLHSPAISIAPPPPPPLPPIAPTPPTPPTPPSPPDPKTIPEVQPVAPMELDENK